LIARTGSEEKPKKFKIPDAKKEQIRANINKFAAKPQEKKKLTAKPKEKSLGENKKKDIKKPVKKSIVDSPFKSSPEKNLIDREKKEEKKDLLLLPVLFLQYF